MFCAVIVPEISSRKWAAGGGWELLIPSPENKQVVSLRCPCLLRHEFLEQSLVMQD